MTPEQTRNYWILEGYPLMPEWIEFYRKHEDPDYLITTADVDAWWNAVRTTHGVGGDAYAYFDFVDSRLAFVIPGVVTYVARGEDHAIE